MTQTAKEGSGMRFYGLKSCDTCRKALAALRSAGHNPLLVDVRADGIPADTLARFLSAFGADLINRRSTTWRTLDDAARSRDPADLLTAHPAVLKRPVIEHDGQLYLGWAKDVQAALTG